MSEALPRTKNPENIAAEVELKPLGWSSPRALPAELLTGHKAIDFEHAQLLSCIETLRSVCVEASLRADCSGCSESQRGTCETHLVGMLGDLLAFVLDHFKTEEDVMRKSLLLSIDREVCHAHIEDHANISAKVQEIVAALDPLKNVVLLRELDSLLQRWIENHVLLHDTLLCRWLESRGHGSNFS
jgi:hemerythrin-like metal-binding protein